MNKKLPLLALALTTAITGQPHALADETIYEGELTNTDPYNEQNKYVDTYTIEVEPGRMLELDLNTEEFDCYLIAVSPTGEQHVNDDFGSTRRSYLEFFDTTPGEWTIQVTSYGSDATGAYNLAVRTVEAREMELVFDLEEVLNEDDEIGMEGKYYDRYALVLERGDRVRVGLQSDDFDAYLVVVGPDNLRQTDDDGGDGVNSMLQFNATTDGTYYVFATSLSAWQQGNYSIQIQRSQSE